MARELHQLETQILARLPQSAARAPWREVVEIAPEPALVRRICAEGSRPVCWVLADKRAGMRYRRLDRFDRESVEEALLEWARGIGNAWRPASVPEPDLEGRAERWQEAAPSAALTLLSEGLEALRVLHEPEAPFEVPALAVWVDPQALELRAEIASAQPEQNPTTLKIALAEQEEEGGLRVSPENAPSPWIAALAAWGRDAIHDPAHPLHAELRSVAITPRWLRLLDALGEHLPPAEISPERPPERLAWRVGMSERGQLEIEPALQKRGKRGWTHGRAVEPAQIATLAVADELDRRVVRRWREASDDASTPGAGVGEALLALVGHPRVVCSPGGGAALRVREVAVSARVEGSGRRRVLFTVGGDVVEAEELVPWLMPPHHLVRLNEPRREVLVATVSDSFAKIVRTVAEWDAAIPMSADETLLALLLRLPAEIGLELPSDLGGPMQPADGRIYIQLEPLPHGGARVRFSIRPLGDARRYSPGAGPAHLVGARDGIRVRTSRQLPLERVEAERWVERLGLSRARSESPHCFLLDEPEEAIELVRRLSEPDEALVVEWPADELPWQIHEGVGQLATRVRHANEWFEVDGELHIDEHRVELAALLAAAREGRRYVALGGGHFARIDDALRSQLDAAEDLLVERGGALVAGAEAALALDRALGATLERDRAWETLLGRIEAADSQQVEIPSGLQADLRDYQEEGVHWLLRLERWASGACLADEMGLGKTVQALALLLHRGKAGPSIVVLPTSLSDGWASEATRFAPALRTIVYRGPERAALLEGLGPNDLLLCSYEVLVRDLETLSAIEWSTTVFDEAHALKTYRTRRARAARELRSGFRLALTGTPLENHLGELWSLFGILLPGLLGPWPRFRRRFALPIEEDGNAARRAGLVRVLSPFLLRRTKAQVARELPPRTDVIQPVELSADEMALYEAERRRAVRELGSAGEEESGRFAMLAALMRLRRLACHPALVHPGSTIPSSKLEAFLELVTDLHSEGHRALVFSQFTSHLGIVRDALNRRGVQLLYLDGSTPAAHRSELVRQWQEGDLPIFLISLKAGGTGLNLTAADTVIHLDPWWNPATEDQASDRAHRIGQTLPVTIIRLIARGTIEEKVLALHDEKRDLARGILEGSESNAKLEIKDLMALLRTGPNL